MTPVMPMGGVVDRYRRYAATARPAGRGASASRTRGPARTRRSGAGSRSASCTRRCCAVSCASTRTTPCGSPTPGTRRPSASSRRGTARPWPSTAPGSRRSTRSAAAPSRPRRRPTTSAPASARRCPLAMSRDPDVFRAGPRDLELPGVAAGRLRPAGPGGTGARGRRRRGRDDCRARPRAGARAVVAERAYGTTIGLTLSGSSRPARSAASASSRPKWPEMIALRSTRPEAARAIAVG